MPTGTIARLLIDKGFGFIRDESGIEHFFHRSSVRGAVFELLREGQRVEFTPEESGKGPRAGEVRLIEGGAPHLVSRAGRAGAPPRVHFSRPTSY
jgi:cold shock protein